MPPLFQRARPSLLSLPVPSSYSDHPQLWSAVAEGDSTFVRALQRGHRADGDDEALGHGRVRPGLSMLNASLDCAVRIFFSPSCFKVRGERRV